MKNRTFCIKRLAVPVARCRGIEEIVEMELFSWSHVGLVFDKNDLVVVESILDDFEVAGGDVGDINVVKFGAEVDLRVVGKFERMNSDLACDSHDVCVCVCVRL